MTYLVWGGSQNFDVAKWGDHKISGPLNRGDHKISRVNFAQFFSPPPPVVNVTSLKYGVSRIPMNWGITIIENGVR